jgi:hypothetical protein
MMDNANAGGLQTGVFDPNMPLAPGVKSYGGGMFSGPAAPPPGGFGGWFNPEGPGGGSMPTVPGVQGMPDAMMHPFAPRNRGPQGVGPNMIMPAIQQMQGAMGGGNFPTRRFPGALGRGILQGMAQPPPAPAAPAPYGGQQFRMW